MRGGECGPIKDFPIRRQLAVKLLSVPRGDAASSMPRSSANLSRYNTFNGKPRSLMLYDESLITSDVDHFGTVPLYSSLAACIELVKRIDEHAEISNFLTEVKAIIEAAEDSYDPFDVTMIDQPTIEPRLADKYQRFFGAKDGGKLVAKFLKAANLPLRMLKSGGAAIVSYQVVVPTAIPNIPRVGRDLPDPQVVSLRL